MQNPKPPHYSLFRQMLFPYSGLEVLSFRQILRVILAWMFFFPLLISLLIAMIAIPFSSSLQGMAMLFLFSLISGACIFGCLGLLVAVTNNWSVRVHQTRKAAREHHESGGTYGS
ncbi:MAG TPA: hypothetical protein VKR42_01375 [Ktedonobacteraceae bacterium]|nr:hypothetical protein [Ktedonobacteraceae bacterium]